MKFEIQTQNGLRPIHDPVQPGVSLVVVSIDTPEVRVGREIAWYWVAFLGSTHSSELICAEYVYTPREADRGKWIRALVNDVDWTINSVQIAAEE